MALKVWMCEGCGTSYTTEVSANKCQESHDCEIPIVILKMSWKPFEKTPSRLLVQAEDPMTGTYEVVFERSG